MYWSDRIAQDIINSGNYKPYWVDDMKTPSGRIHVGSLRGVVLHDLIFRSLIDKGKKATYTYVFEDHDPLDKLPHYLDRKEWGKHLGKPLFHVPSPKKGARNYAEYFSLEFKKVFNDIGSNPRIIWGSELYLSGKMNKGVKRCLDNRNIVKKIYEKLYNRKMPKSWYPYNAVCPNCGKMATTVVTDWDGENIVFECKKDAVDWTKGCGENGKTSPFSDSGRFAGKLPWKVEWPVKWQAIGVTIEGAGKDHMTAGGSYDVAKLICEQVLKYPTPYAFSYEHFLINGKKMSSSKGLGKSAKEIAEILPPYLLRFLMVRTHAKKAIDFNPTGMVIPDLFDEFDRAARAFWSEKDKNLARMFELSQVNDRYNKRVFLPRFRDVAAASQLYSIIPEEHFESEKGDKLTTIEKKILDERMRYANKWLKNYAPEQMRFTASKTLPKSVCELSEKQKKYLQVLSSISFKQGPVSLQIELYDTAKKLNLSGKDAFSAIYSALLGKTHGPKAAWFIASLDPEFVIKRFKDAAS